AEIATATNPSPTKTHYAGSSSLTNASTGLKTRQTNNRWSLPWTMTNSAARHKQYTKNPPAHHTLTRMACPIKPPERNRRTQTQAPTWDDSVSQRNSHQSLISPNG